MFLLMGWRKPGDDGDVVIAVCEEEGPLVEVKDSLNYAAGYTPGHGMWDSERTKGRFYVAETPVTASNELENRLEEWLNTSKTSEALKCAEDRLADLPEYPCRFDEMTNREQKIALVASHAVGALEFIRRKIQG